MENPVVHPEPDDTNFILPNDMESSEEEDQSNISNTNSSCAFALLRMSLFDCPLCTKSYTSKEQADKHMARKHFTNYQTCPTCGLQFQHPHAFNFHVDSHTKAPQTSSDKQFKCEQANCEKAFKWEMNLHRHLTFHRNSLRLYTCEYCEVCLGNQEDYKFHVDNRSSSDGSCVSEPEGECEFCGKVLNTVEGLRKHQSNGNSCPFLDNANPLTKPKEDNDFPNKSKIKLHACKECDKNFTSKGRLVEHCWIHLHKQWNSKKISPVDTEIEKPYSNYNPNPQLQSSKPKIEVTVKQTTKRAEIIKSATLNSNDYSLKNLDDLSKNHKKQIVESRKQKRNENKGKVNDLQIKKINFKTEDEEIDIEEELKFTERNTSSEMFSQEINQVKFFSGVEDEVSEIKSKTDEEMKMNLKSEVEVIEISSDEDEIKLELSTEVKTINVKIETIEVPDVVNSCNLTSTNPSVINVEPNYPSGVEDEVSEIKSETVEEVQGTVKSEPEINGEIVAETKSSVEFQVPKIVNSFHVASIDPEVEVKLEKIVEDKPDVPKMKKKRIYFECKKCHAKFKQSCELESHFAIHVRLLGFSNNKINSMCKFKPKILKEKKKRKQQLHFCPMCIQTFAHWGLLKKHYQQIHPDLQIPEKQKQVRQKKSETNKVQVKAKETEQVKVNKNEFESITPEVMKNGDAGNVPKRCRPKKIKVDDTKFPELKNARKISKYDETEITWKKRKRRTNKNTKDEFFCVPCATIFSTKSSLNRHSRDAHGGQSINNQFDEEEIPPVLAEPLPDVKVKAEVHGESLEFEDVEDLQCESILGLEG